MNGMLNVIEILTMLIFPISTPIIYFAVKKRRKVNYSLRKDAELGCSVDVVIPQDIVKYYGSAEESKLLKGDFGNLIIEFSQKIDSILSPEDKKTFENNLKSLKVNDRSDAIKKHNMLGCYNSFSNIIDIWSKDFDTVIFHELLHCASTRVITGSEKVYSGFSQSDKENIVGSGINEGYTEYLAKKHFKSVDSAYVFETSVARFVEKIIGQEKMQSLYFNSDLGGLVSTLGQWSSEDDCIEFINNVDLLSAYSRETLLNKKSKKYLEEISSRVNLFLVTTSVKSELGKCDAKSFDVDLFLKRYNSILDYLPISNVNSSAEFISSLKVLKFTILSEVQIFLENEGISK